MKPSLVALLGALLLSIAVAEVRGQAHTVEIRDGRVLVNGSSLPKSAMPSTLNLEAVQGRFTFSEGTHAVFHVDGRLYRISPSGIQDMGEASYVISGMTGGADVALTGEMMVSVEASADEAEIALISRQAELLRERARELQRLTLELEHSRGYDATLFEMIESIRHSAQETEQVARSLPQLHAQQYMEDMRQRNEELYRQLLREQELELETVILSRRIRRTHQEAERGELVSTLRARLDEIFEIKQENRRREIAEMEERLSSLQYRLEKRERYHDLIIQKRLQELIGDPPQSE